MTQPPLDFTRTHAHRSDPETSREAARKAKPKFSAGCKHVLMMMSYIGDEGATYKDIIALGGSQQRFSDLCLMQRIVWNGEKRDGCRVYVVAE